MITRIEIDGFKTFQNFRLDLSPLQVVVGYAPLGEQISLKALDQVPAYQRFASDLERAVNRIGFI